MSLVYVVRLLHPDRRDWLGCSASIFGLLAAALFAVRLPRHQNLIRCSPMMIR
jgi:hypothetical protein